MSETPDKKQPKTRKNYKRKPAAPVNTAQVRNYVKRKIEDQRKKNQDAINENYAVNAAENAALELTEEAAKVLAPNKQKQPQDSKAERSAASQDTAFEQEQAADPQRPYTRSAGRAATNNVLPTTGGEEQRSRLEPKRKPQYAPKTRPTQESARPSRAVQASRENTTMQRAVSLGREKAQCDMRIEFIRQAKKTAELADSLAKKSVTAIVRAIQSATTMAAGSFGIAGLVALVGIILLLGAIVVSPFGILFTNSPTKDSVTLSSAVAQINMEYANRLRELQNGDYADIHIEGEPPEWVEVVAVFACHIAWSEDGIDVATLDNPRIELLRSVFWDMCDIAAEVVAANNGAEESTDTTQGKPTLFITITAKTADEMRIIYNFTDNQNEALDALLEDADTLEELLGDLSISSEAAAAILANLSSDVSEERQKVIQQALMLVGKVNYFWGGKSLVLGWDDRWGKLYKVFAAGSPSTGMTRPYGLDCSGFVDWVFYNVSGGKYILGHGGGAQAQHGYCERISWEEAQPGDLVFYPRDTHVGIIGGVDEDGNIQIIHCESVNNNVIVSGIMGFTSVGRPHYYGE